MTTCRVIRIPILPLGMVNAHLLVSEGGCVLVDTGLPGSDKAIGKILAREGLSWGDLKLIVVTHAHVDHAGCAARVRELSGAPILAHRGDTDYYQRKRPMTLCPTGWFGRVFIKTKLPHEPYVAFSPDILLEDAEPLKLEQFGVNGLVRHTAGHTPGSIAVELCSGDALVGDLVASGILVGGIALVGRAMRPPFEDDPLTVSRELQRLASTGSKRFYMGHGGPLDAPEVLRHARYLASIAPSGCRDQTCDHKH